jgi:hypothetical protein
MNTSTHEHINTWKKWWRSKARARDDGFCRSGKFDLLVRKEQLCALAVLRHSLYALCAVDTRQLDLLLNLATTRSSL